MTYFSLMEFIEFPAFTDQIEKFLSVDEQHALQIALINRPDMGALIRGSGGLRKMRWKLRAGGKRGGLRIIYYLYSSETFYMLYAYKKSDQEDLTPNQLKLLRDLMKGISHEG